MSNEQILKTDDEREVWRVALAGAYARPGLTPLECLDWADSAVDGYRKREPKVSPKDLAAALDRLTGSELPPDYLGECPGCGFMLLNQDGAVDGQPLECGCDGHWSVDSETCEPLHDDECRQCAREEQDDEPTGSGQ